MKKINFILFACILLAGFACRNENEVTVIMEEPENVIPEPPEDIPPPETGLKDTKWKLAGMVEAKTGELKELEPKDCETCYTLEFYNDTMATGRSSINIIGVILSRKSQIIFVMTEAYDHENGDIQLFYDLLEKVDSYSVEENELKFFYNNEQNYLLYKPLIQP
jgi:hypothetical protein